MLKLGRQDVCAPGGEGAKRIKRSKGDSGSIAISNVSARITVSSNSEGAAGAFAQIFTVL
jgi:hypothetical protein